ncbi:hypothetical protein LTR97_003218 [Elasticomyces elasticus]|uniref:Uncharacterized protein n=1 Tax=Elasticomyces elasticus TaxID=574655 RepID=A0AAN7WE66_9PEZI|nr:hypothetical protein LTR97_003218 [Elasticomyces elasticus]
MAATSSDLLKRLPPELRLDIYTMVLSTNLIVHRPFPGDFAGRKFGGIYIHWPFAQLLVASKYIYQEAVDIFYSKNEFGLTLDEISGVAPEAYCKIRTIALIGLWNPNVSNVKNLLLKFRHTTTLSISATEDSKLDLRTLTVLTKGHLEDRQLREIERLVNGEIGPLNLSHDDAAPCSWTVTCTKNRGWAEWW